MIIKNYEEIGFSGVRRKALEIVNAGIESVLPEKLLKCSVRFEKGELWVRGRRFRVRGRVFVIGGGKAVGRMSRVLEEIMGEENIEDGIVNCNVPEKTRKIRVNRAGHPYPDRNGLRGVKEMLGLKEKYGMGKDDLVICLISGGGSSLLPYPVDGISFEDKKKVTDLLLKCGAKIQEINKVRKHLSKVKGGRLAEYFYPVRIVSLIISDVVGDPVETIASGPTAFDSSTFRDVYRVFEKYGILDRIPESVLEYVEKGMRGEVPETPKKTPENSRNFVIGNNMIALRAMERKAKELGFRSEIVTNKLEGECSLVARKYARIVRKKFESKKVFLLGGETTVTIRGEHGKGGRNQEYVVSSLWEMRNFPGEWVVISVGTDGMDFMSEWAGGIIDNNSFDLAKKLNLDIERCLERHDSHSLLKRIKGLVSTGGSTGTNVGDLVVYLMK